MSATVSFTPPAHNGGLHILAYRIVVQPGSRHDECRAPRCVVLGLTAGTSYVFRVAAINRMGTGRYSAPSNAVTPTATQLTIDFNANGGSGSMPSQVVDLGVASALSPNVFSRPGFTFTGWNTSADATGTSYTDGAVSTFDGDVTLYAQWQLDAGQVVVTFDPNGGAGAMPSEASTSGVAASLSPNAFTYQGYTFDGWNTAADATGTSYADGATYPFSADVTLYAQWVVTFDPSLTPDGSSTNWSGYVLSGQSGGYQEVGGRWRVPVLDCGATPDAKTSDWVGVNGTDAAPGLFQDGTTSQCINGVQTNYAWWTDEAQNYVSIDLFPVTTGDMFRAQVYQDASGSWVYYVKDLSSGTTSSSVEPYAGTGLTAEWIAEDPGNVSSGGLYPLASFEPVTFTDLTLIVVGGSWYLPTMVDAMEMVASDGSLAAVPTAVLGTGLTAEFTVYYRPLG